MKNPVFNKKMIALALNHNKWRIVSSLLPKEQTPVENKNYMTWASERRHCHTQKEILFVFSGKTFHSFKGKCHECRPGSVFLFDSFEQHDCNYRETDDDFIHLWLMFVKDNIFAALHHRDKGNHLSRRFMLGRLETELMLEAWNDLKANPVLISPEFRRARLAAAVSNILLKVLEMSFSDEEDKEPSERQKMIIESIKGHLNETCGRNETIDNLAHIAGYSKFHFIRLFKEHTGQTVLEYINNCRIRRTREMLRKFHSKKDISYTLGFSSPSAFSNWCRKNI